MSAPTSKDLDTKASIPADEPSRSEMLEGRGAFGGFIGPRNLVALVKSAAPFLFDGTHPDTARLPSTSGRRLYDHAFHPLGWWSVLGHADLLEAHEHPAPEARTDYFALCLAAHFASVATFVPTDVDAKIRHALWFETMPREELARMCHLAHALSTWDIRGISARTVNAPGVGFVSGHDGERLSVLCGGLLGLLAAGDAEGAASFEAEIDAELAREARAFDRLASLRGREIELLSLATILTHNAGDVMQGLSAKRGKHVGEAQKQRFRLLAHERFERYEGAFGRAAALYKELLASEGHRHYPLREVKHLRTDAALLLPLGPFLDDWGAKLARHPAWSQAQRAAVVGALVEGCRKVKGQEAYYRALCGFDVAHPGGLESHELASHFTTSVRRELKTTDMRKKLAVRRESFESSYTKRARAILSREAWARRL